MSKTSARACLLYITQRFNVIIVEVVNWRPQVLFRYDALNNAWLMFLKDVEGWAYVIDSQYVEFEIQNKY